MFQLVESLGRIVKLSDDDMFYFTNSGAEIVEAAIKLARQATGRQHIVSFRPGFHGRTMGATAVTSSKYGFSYVCCFSSQFISFFSLLSRSSSPFFSGRSLTVVPPSPGCTTICSELLYAPATVHGCPARSLSTFRTVSTVHSVGSDLCPNRAQSAAACLCLTLSSCSRSTFRPRTLRQ